MIKTEIKDYLNYGKVLAITNGVIEECSNKKFKDFKKFS